MFTGIIRGLGQVAGWEDRAGGRLLRLLLPPGFPPPAPGGSLAVNGVCLTAEKAEGREVTFHLSRETLERTNLGRLRPREEVNLEPPLRLGEELGGHLVLGHVDGVGRVEKREGEEMWFRAPREVLPYLVPKGSVAVDGVSLTVAELAPPLFRVALIPYTLEHTNLGRKKPGEEVNLEADILAKTVARLIAPYLPGAPRPGTHHSPGFPHPGTHRVPPSGE